MKIRLGLMACWVLASAAGCSGKSDAEKLADSYCSEVAKCCSQAGLSPDDQGCHALWTLANMAGSYNAQAGSACLAEIQSQASAGTFCANLSSSSPSACDSVYGSSSGSKQPGEPCDFDSDCAPSSEGKVVCASVYVNGAFIDKCQLQIPGSAGDSPCVGTQDGNTFWNYTDSNATDVVSRGYVCDLASNVRCRFGTCTALVAVGGTCGLTSDCELSAFCDLNAKLCVARVPAGGSCTGTDPSECVDGYYCPASSPKQCTAQLANGGSCTASFMCRSGYCVNNICGNDTTQLTFLCK